MSKHRAIINALATSEGIDFVVATERPGSRGPITTAIVRLPDGSVAEIEIRTTMYSWERKHG